VSAIDSVDFNENWFHEAREKNYDHKKNGEGTYPYKLLSGGTP